MGVLPYVGPERRRSAGVLHRLMAVLLDEIDHGMLVVTAAGRVLHMNHAASARVAGVHPLRVDNGQLTARTADTREQLAAALTCAANVHRRSLLHLWQDGVDHPVSVMPLPSVEEVETSAPRMVLIKLGRHELAGMLAMGAFARAHGLSQREQEMLAALCEGAKPGEIAAQLGLSLPTVRSHIHNLRRKTGATSVTDLLRQVARLPPMLPAIRS